MMEKIHRTEYALIWKAPRNSSIDFPRLLVTWVGIIALGSAAVYVHYLSTPTKTG
jgi:hypothetical protein